MPVNHGGLRLGASSLPDPTEVLGLAADGCKSGRILRVSITGLQGGDTGGTAPPQHIQCGGGCGDVELGRGDGRGRGWEGQART